MSTIITIISISYLILFIIYSGIEIRYVLITKQTKVISFIRAMYALIYGLIPFLIHSSYNYINLNIDYSQQGIIQIIILQILSIIGYISLNIGYVLKFKLPNKRKKMLKESKLLKAGIIILVISLLSILLWTNAYGSPLGIIEHASAIRSDRSHIYNPFAFMKHTSSLVMFASYIFYSLIINNKNKKNIGIFILFLISVGGSIFYIIANDGRMLAGVYLFMFVITDSRVKLLEGKKSIQKIIVQYIFIGIIALMLISFSGPALYYVQYGIWDNTSISIIQILKNEFGYTVISGQNALNYRYNNYMPLRFLEDILSGLLAWMPARYTQDTFTTLFELNTSLTSGTTGTVPTDFITMTIYSLGVLGSVVIPVFTGIFIKVLDTYYETIKSKHEVYYSFLYTLISFYLLKSISHFDLNNIMLNIFYFVIGHIIVLIVNKFTLSQNHIKRNILYD